mgnify:CR=1 FL=1
MMTAIVDEHSNLSKEFSRIYLKRLITTKSELLQQPDDNHSYPSHTNTKSSAHRAKSQPSWHTGRIHDHRINTTSNKYKVVRPMRHHSSYYLRLNTYYLRLTTNY